MRLAQCVSKSQESVYENFCAYNNSLCCKSHCCNHHILNNSDYLAACQHTSTARQPQVTETSGKWTRIHNADVAIPSVSLIADNRLFCTHSVYCQCSSQREGRGVQRNLSCLAPHTAEEIDRLPLLFPHSWQNILSLGSNCEVLPIA